MLSFLMFFTYKKSLFFRGSTSYAYGFNTLLLSDVMLKSFKTYQPHNPWYILMTEVPHGFTLSFDQIRGINHSVGDPGKEYNASWVIARGAHKKPTKASNRVVSEVRKRTSNRVLSEVSILSSTGKRSHTRKIRT